MSLWFLIVLFLVWIACIFFLRRYRVWILYYLVGTVGLSFFLVYTITKLHAFEPMLAHSVALSVHDLLGMAGIPTEIFENAPGVLLVLVVTQNVGWTVLQIGVESSGLLEICVLISLVAFYPLWKLPRKILLCLFGIAFTWLANVLRMVLIALLLHYFGKSVLVLAHTFLGKALFFLFTIAIYWFLVSSTTLKEIRKGLVARTKGANP
jgi:exosortase family protein XrtG